MLTTPPDDRDLIRSQNRGSRTYAIGGQSYPSVTSIISQGEAKPALINWAKKVTAEAAVAQHELVKTLIDTDGPQAAIDHLKGAAYRQRNAAGDLGSRLHEVAEYEVLEGKEYPDPGDPEARELLNHFRHFLAEVQPEFVAVEAVVVNQDYGYAGTLDACATIPMLRELGPVLLDWKSGSGVYGSYGMQLAAYANAESVVGPNGLESWEGVTNTEVAYVVHITPRGWRLVEMHIGEETFDAFLSCMQMAEWASFQDSVVGQVVAKGRATGGKALHRKEDTSTPEEAVVAPVTVGNFGNRRKIQPPTLKSS